MLEMKIVLRAVIERNVLVAVGDRPETARRRSITISPSRGCEVILRHRSPATPPASEEHGPPISSSRPAASMVAPA
jgi:hypothetical protein